MPVRRLARRAPPAPPAPPARLARPRAPRTGAGHSLIGGRGRARLRRAARGRARDAVTSASLTTRPASELVLAFVSANGPARKAESVTALTGAGLKWKLAIRADKEAGTAEVWEAHTTAILRKVKVTARLHFAGYNGSITIASFSGTGSALGAHVAASKPVLSHTGTASTALQFDGQYSDAESGYLYLQARYYDPSTGQFLSLDPAVDLTGEPYGYAADNPLNASDPTGLSWWSPLTWNKTLRTVVGTAATVVGLGLAVVGALTTCGGGDEHTFECEILIGGVAAALAPFLLAGTVAAMLGAVLGGVLTGVQEIYDAAKQLTARPPQTTVVC
jgi:RHS repeat-associated protein